MLIGLITCSYFIDIQIVVETSGTRLKSLRHAQIRMPFVSTTMLIGLITCSYLIDIQFVAETFGTRI